MCGPHADVPVESRIRHVKCDEKKPSCHRCRSTSRKCDWTRRTNTAIIRSNGAGVTVSIPRQQLPGTSEESSYFQFFCTKTTLQLSGLFGSTFWNQEVLQSCVSHPAVWHAAVAVASLQQERRQTICRLTDGDEPLSEFTLDQYVKAMQNLRGLHRQPRPAAEVVLLCCILFICFESLRGHCATAMVHLDYGLRLLSEIEPEDQKDSSTPDRLFYSRNSVASIEDLALIFTRLDTQANQLLWNRKSTRNPKLEDLKWGIIRDIPRLCPSMEETKKIADQIWNFCLCSLQPAAGKSASRYGDTRAVTLQLCSTKFEQSFAAFERFMEHSGRALDAKGRQAANAMRICHIVASMCLMPAYQKNMDDEEIFRNHNKQFSEIICLVTNIIDSSVDESLGEDTLRFTLDGCVLGPLFFVAVRCRHKILRRKAIALLRLTRRLEGLWDSHFLAQVAENVMEIEEKGDIDSTNTTKPLRIADIDVEFENHRRRALVGYIVKDFTPSLGAEITNRKDVVVW